MNVGIPLEAMPSVTGNGDEYSTESQKAGKAAQDFEALLIGQMLRSVREEESGWLGTGDDDAGSTALGLGEEELAKAIAAGGGFGLAKIIASGLAARPTAPGADKP